MKCTNEDPCGNCDVCDLEGEVGGIIANALYRNCESTKCKGCEHCNNCEHGEEINCCEICSPPAKCGHGITYDNACEACNEEAERVHDQWLAEQEDDSECEHGTLERDCMECAAENDRLAQHAKDREDWDLFHPVE